MRHNLNISGSSHRRTTDTSLGQAVLYTPLTPMDGPGFFRLAGDERVAATMRFDCPHTLDESRRVLETYLSPGNRTFALRFRPEEELWGVFAFKSEPGSDTACLSQMLTPARWGRGLGRQVLRDMVALARKNGWYRTLEGYILESNVPSRRMAERNGFLEQERHRYPDMEESLLVYRLEL